MNPQVLSETGNAMTGAFTTIATSITDGIGSIAPIALTVMGAMLLWRVGTKFFKNTAK